MQINKDTIELVKHFEGFSSNPYHDSIDPPGICTIGYGTIQYPSTYLDGKKVGLNDPRITTKQGEEFLMWELNKKAKIITPSFLLPLTNNQFGALVSFTYNLGEGNLRSSTLLKKVNRDPKDPTIRNEFVKWIYSDGKKIEGLLRRRIAEADLYFKI